MTRTTDSSMPGDSTIPPVPRLQRRLSAVVGATGTVLIIASAVLCYRTFFYLPPAEGAMESSKMTLLIAVALFLSGAAALVGATRLHGD